jgi:hypothetical protein
MGRGGARLIAISVIAALTLAACGDDESGSDSAAEDEAAIEQLFLDYAAVEGSDACDLFSEKVIAGLGGRKACERDQAGAESVTIKVDEIEVDGDTAQALVTLFPEDKQYRFPVVREGEASDSYDGWRVDELDVEEVTAEAGEDGAEETTTETIEETIEATEETEETVAESPPQTPEQKAAAYTACVEGRGASDVEQDDFPTVDFSGGGSRVIASFGSTEEDAKQGFATISQRDPFFVERFGTVVLYAVGDPLADDLDIGLSCVKEVG